MARNQKEYADCFWGVMPEWEANLWAETAKGAPTATAACDRFRELLEEERLVAMPRDSMDALKENPTAILNKKIFNVLKDARFINQMVSNLRVEFLGLSPSPEGSSKKDEKAHGKINVWIGTTNEINVVIHQALEGLINVCNELGVNVPAPSPEIDDERKGGL